MTKKQKLERKADLLQAQLAACNGDYETARRLFAKHGMSFIPFVAN
jgi:hypothetical protein